ncbi:putative 2-phospho-L-lactate transferase CofD, CofD-like domain superfamily [Helianthus debilis subsp. tardiflorus]
MLKLGNPPPLYNKPLQIQFCLSSSSSRSIFMSSINALHSPSATSLHPSILVFSGGTAFNGVVEELKKLTTSVAHVLPVSDDGGSTAEIVRVLGGPAVGDIRSRCLRLSDESTSEALAVRTLLGYRLPLDAREAKLEWYGIVEGEHPLWKDVSKPYRETIRSFLAYFQSQVYESLLDANAINGYAMVD